MIKNDVHFFDGLNSIFDLLDWHIDLFGEVFPCLFDVIYLIDVQGARVRSKLVPDFLVDFNAYLFLEVFHSVLEGVRVTCGGTVVEPDDSF